MTTEQRVSDRRVGDVPVQPFQIIAARLASVDRAARDNFLHYRDSDALMRLDFDVWFILRDDVVIVVDTGFNHTTGDRRGRVLDKTVGEAAQEIGIDPASVRDVVITHLHYDHAGGISEFPAARIWIQQQELAFALGPPMGHPTLRHFFEADDVKVLIDRIFASQVRAVDGMVELVPGVELHRIGGHTPGLQVVRVWTDRGWVVLASDALHYYENHSRRDPFPAIVDLPQMLDGYDRIEALADGPDHIVPGHDPLVMQIYPRDGLPDGMVAVDQPPRTR